MEYKDYYKILGVDKSADEKEIKKAKCAAQLNDVHLDQVTLGLVVCGFSAPDGAGEIVV